MRDKYKKVIKMKDGLKYEKVSPCSWYEYCVTRLFRQNVAFDRS